MFDGVGHQILHDVNRILKKHNIQSGDISWIDIKIVDHRESAAKCIIQVRKYSSMHLKLMEINSELELEHHMYDVQGNIVLKNGDFLFSDFDPVYDKWYWRYIKYPVKPKTIKKD